MLARTPLHNRLGSPAAVVFRSCKNQDCIVGSILSSLEYAFGIENTRVAHFLFLRVRTYKERRVKTEKAGVTERTVIRQTVHGTEIVLIKNASPCLQNNVGFQNY